MTVAERKLAHAEKKMVDVYVEINLDALVSWVRRGDLEARAKELEAAAREFEEFVRDHRSQDRIGLTVIRKYIDACSACGNEWEVGFDGDEVFCASCGVAVARA